METFRTGDIVVSTVNPGPTWIIREIREMEFLLEVRNMPQEEHQDLIGNRHTLDFQRGQEILRHQSEFAAIVKHVIEDAESRAKSTNADCA